MTRPLPKYIRIVLWFTFINLIILAIRNIAVGDHFYNFIKSNLFIGSFPVILIAFLLDHFDDKINKVMFWIGTALWVLFYPNAPYMISDLIHNSQDPLSTAHPDLIKFDTLILFSFAMLSVFYGFLSIKIMFNLFRKRYSVRFAHIAIIITVILSCLGFYMGRELLSAIKLGNGYLYSWEIFLEPLQIIKIVWHALWPIGTHWTAYAMMALFGFIQYMMLVMFKDVSDVEQAGLITKD
jgi:uncharacterized membrane protein